MESVSPTVTVGMPVFNGEKHIRQAIESVLKQTREDFELLISDNASTDRTAAICREYAARDGRIRFVAQDENRGAYWNFRFVTDHARGRFLIWLAHDDALDERCIEESVSHLCEHSQTVVVCGDVRIIDDCGEQIEMETLDSIRESIDWQRRCGELYKYPISNALFAVYGMMRTKICREVLARVKPRKQLAQIELPILARFAAKGQICSLPIVLSSYRRHGTSLYNTEATARSRKSWIKRYIIGHVHIARLRIDQIAVLLMSSAPSKFKIGVLFEVGKFYFFRIALKLRGASSSHTADSL
jgi:glycosyltransferase involved in cell wall biosynthesis